MIIQSAWPLSFDFGGSKPIIVELSAAQISSDAGLLPFRQLDEQLGLTRQFVVLKCEANAQGTNRHATKFLRKRLPAVSAAVGTTAAASATRWAKANPAHGAPG